MLITGLKPDTEYSITLAAVSKVGDGESTDPIIVRTSGAVPSPPTELKLTLVDGEQTTVRVTWKPPLKTYGKIEKYKVIYTAEGDKYTTERRLDPRENNKFEAQMLGLYMFTLNFY